MNNTLSEEELHKEIEERRAYNLKIKNFILCMKKISPVFCDKNIKRDMSLKKMQKLMTLINCCVADRLVRPHQHQNEKETRWRPLHQSREGERHH